MKSIPIPDELYQRAAKLADADQVSVDRLVIAVLNEGIEDWARLLARAERGSLEKLHRVLSKVSDAPAESRDQL